MVKSAAVLAILLASTGANGQGNPLARPTRDISSLGGVWNGSHIEQRQSCRNAQNNGFRGTYSEFRIYVDVYGRGFSIDEAGVTGLSCSWLGQLRDEGWRMVAFGTLSCSDGRSGTFESQSYFTSSTLMTMRLAVQLTGSETCAIDAILTGAHF